MRLPLLLRLIFAFVAAQLLVNRSVTAETPPAAASLPDGWHQYSARDEIAPRFWFERFGDSADKHTYVLGLAGRGDAAVDGRWQRRVPVEGGNFYQFHAEYRAEKVATPARSVLARVLWFNEAGKQVEQAEYPVTENDDGDDWIAVRGVYQAPTAAAQAQLELHLRWAPTGRVVWRSANLKEAAPPAPRVVRLASVNHRPRGSKSAQHNLEQFARHIEAAAQKRADIVCLPEGITVVGTNKKYADVAEPIPGPSTEFLGHRAAKHNLYVVAGLYEREGTAVYNTSVLLGRDGKLIGKYRKVCLPREEIDGGITPGTEYPVFETDFGRVGMMICWDVHFPEVARELAAAGAEVILVPIWGGNELLARARAVENQVYVVASGYDFKTAIFDKEGRTLAEAQKDPSVIVSEVDLNERLLWPWLGDFRARIWREGPARP